jgi:hypothetical protein
MDRSRLVLSVYDADPGTSERDYEYVMSVYACRKLHSMVEETHGNT